MSFLPTEALNLTQVLIRLSPTTTQASSGTYVAFSSCSSSDSVTLTNSTTISLIKDKQYFIMGPSDFIVYYTSAGPIQKGSNSYTLRHHVNGLTIYNATTASYITQFPCRFWSFMFGGIPDICIAVLHPTINTQIKLEYKWHKKPGSNIADIVTPGAAFSNSTAIDEPNSYLYIFHN